MHQSGRVWLPALNIDGVIVHSNLVASRLAPGFGPIYGSNLLCTALATTGIMEYSYIREARLIDERATSGSTNKGVSWLSRGFRA